MDVREALAESSRTHGPSLQAYLLALVQAAAQREQNRGLLDRFAGRADGSGSAADAAVTAIDDIRRERDVALAESLGCSLVTADRRLASANGTLCHVLVAGPSAT